MIPLPLCRYEFSLQARAEVHLPPFLGSTLRGAFGQALRAVACPCGPIADEQSHEEVCPYGRIFAPRAGRSLRTLSVAQESARPYVLQVPRVSPEVYPPGAEIRFGLVLIGQAVQMFPYFLIAIRDFSATGLGRGRGSVELMEVWAVSATGEQKHRIYQAQEGLVHSHALAFTAAQRVEGLPTSASSVTLHFLTNTRLKYEGRWQRHPVFAAVLSRLLDRLEALAVLHADLTPDWDGRALKQAAREVELMHDETVWVPLSRYSQRQRQRQPLDGFVGQATYQGELAPFLPFLQLGEYVHLGHGCVYGLGQMKMQLA